MISRSPGWPLRIKGSTRDQTPKSDPYLLSRYTTWFKRFRGVAGRPHTSRQWLASLSAVTDRECDLSMLVLRHCPRAAAHGAGTRRLQPSPGHMRSDEFRAYCEPTWVGGNQTQPPPCPSKSDTKPRAGSVGPWQCVQRLYLNSGASLSWSLVMLTIRIA